MVGAGRGPAGLYVVRSRGGPLSSAVTLPADKYCSFLTETFYSRPTIGLLADYMNYGRVMRNIQSCLQFLAILPDSRHHAS